MSSHKHFALVCCLLCAALPARAEKPNDNRKGNDDNRANDASQQTNSGYTKEWGGKSIHDWIKDLRHPDPTNRVEALLAIPNFKQSADAVPDIVKRLYDDGDASVRVKAAKLMQMIPTHKVDRTRVISALAHALHDPQSVVRYDAAVSLQVFCPLNYGEKKERDAIQDLLSCLGSTSTYELREVCVVTLYMAGVDPNSGPDARVTDALMRHANPMNEPASRVRLQAIVGLGVQGRPNDRSKFDRVMSVLKMPANFNSRSHPAIRIWAHVSVIALQIEQQKDNKKELDAIAEYLTNREAAVRREAVRALGALEDRSQAYVDNILKLLKTETIPAVRAEAAVALGRMKNTGPAVMSALIRLTEEDKPESFPIVWNACTAFVLLEANNGQVMSALDKVLEHKSLQEFQKRGIKMLIEQLQNPRKKLAKQAPKAPDKGIAPKKK